MRQLIQNEDVNFLQSELGVSGRGDEQDLALGPAVDYFRALDGQKLVEPSVVPA